MVNPITAVFLYLLIGVLLGLKEIHTRLQIAGMERVVAHALLARITWTWPHFYFVMVGVYILDKYYEQSD